MLMRKGDLFGAPCDTLLGIVEVALEVVERRVGLARHPHDVDEAALDVVAIDGDDRRCQVLVVGGVEVSEEHDDDDLVAVSRWRRVHDRLDRVENVHMPGRTLDGRDADRQETCHAAGRRQHHVMSHDQHVFQINMSVIDLGHNHHH